MKGSMKIKAAICSAFLWSLPSAAAVNQNNNNQSNNLVDKNIEKIEVYGVHSRLSSSGALKDSIAKTKVLTDEFIENIQAASLADAIQNAIGIRVSNECSMCGAKRVMINGMKGGHTNVLIDGIPMHTMISGFYVWTPWRQQV
jgi:outer membrane cobalamin receptor